MTDGLDPLASLEIEEGLLPAKITSGLPALEMPTQALESARAKIVELEGEVAAEKARADSLEETVKQLGAGDANSQKLAAEVSVLKADLARRDAQVEAKVDTEFLAPAVVEARGQMALLQQKCAEESFKLSVALQASEARLGEAIVTAQELEYQRDERDDMLRREEATRQQAERDGERAGRQVAMVRLTHIQHADPAKGKADEEINRARTRVLAALGKVGAQVKMGRTEGQCALCDADPGCQRNRLLNWPHGSLVKKEIQLYLQLVVDEAGDRGADPFAALEYWASGLPMSKFDPQPSVEVPEPDQCEAVDAEGGRCTSESGRHTVHSHPSSGGE